MKLLQKDIKPFVRKALINVWVGMKYNDVFIKTRDCRLFYVMSGKGGIEIGGVKYPLSAGSLVLFQSGTEYRWDVGDMKLCIVNFDYTFVAESITKSSSPIASKDFNNSGFAPIYEFLDINCLNNHIVLNGAFSIGEKIKELTIENSIKDAFSKEYTSSLLKNIILNIARIASETTNTKTKNDAALAKGVIEYIQNHLTENINNEDIANYMNFNISYLNRVFKKYTKMTIHAFLLERRLELAMEKLKTETISVSEIALSSGFTDIPHFTKIFKKYVGKTPSEYRSSV
ncbi:MAG: helix-turn-helix domain-containing protein [Clostridia bacterium]|nr:helix-turn-helix domain-containing protein [Clostridia bacterium]